MSDPVTVTFEPAAQQSGDIAQVIASLPLSLTPGADGADLVGIDGVGDWPTRAERAIDAAARGVLIVRPAPADVTALVAKAHEQRVPVVIDSMWSHNPAVDISAAPFADVADDRCVLEARVYALPGSDWTRVLLDHLSLVRAAVSPVSSLEVIRRDEHGYSLSAVLETGGRASITAIGTSSVAQSATLRIVQQQRVVERGAVVGVHQSAPYEDRETTASSVMSSTQYMTAQLLVYLHEMGVDAQLLTLALQTPHDKLYVLGRDELEGTGLTTRSL